MNLFVTGRTFWMILLVSNVRYTHIPELLKEELVSFVVMEKLRREEESK